MISTAHTPVLFRALGPMTSATPTRATIRLRLLANGDGWALVGPDGEIVFQALGTRGRRQCLEYAQAEGVLAVIS